MVARAGVERAAAVIERPLRSVVGSSRANPLPHAGTISVLLLGVVVVSGLYVTLFYEYGFEASYSSVADIDEHPIQGLMRSVHRYSSAALVLTTLVHGWRVFVAGRFTGGRRYRWLTGIAALVIVWLAGVTGYWLVWDLRGQALGEAFERTVGGLGWGAAFVVRNLIGSGAGSGSGLMFGVWLIHILLTLAIGWFLWRHLRRSRLSWLPPRHWTIAMVAGLVVLSLILPADLLGPADPGRLTPDMALDPFMLFLLPPMLSGHAGLVVGLGLLAGALASVVPWVLKDRAAAIVDIDAESCTGCELCVIDCPYLALTMEARDDGLGRAKLAVVDAGSCVGCGICVGSCSFGAIDLQGFDSSASIDCDGVDVVVACSRQARHQGQLADEVVLYEVKCTAMLHPAAIGELTSRGAASVQVVGCASGECVYGIGNVITSERLDRTRAPHVQPKYADVAKQDYVPLGGLQSATISPGTHPDPDVSHAPGTYRSRFAAAGVVGASLFGVGAATLLPFGGDEADASVRIVVDHVRGGQLANQLSTERTAFTGQAPADLTSEAVRVVVAIDGVEQSDSTVPMSGGTAVGVLDTPVEPIRSHLRVSVVEGSQTSVLFDDFVTFVKGRRFLVEARDVPPPPGVAEGKRVFENSRLGGCDVCHSTRPGDNGVGPTLAGVATRAETAVEGLGSAAYLRQSIVDPDAHIVDGYRSGQMLAIYEDRLAGDQIDAVVEYLLSLEGEK